MHFAIDSFKGRLSLDQLAMKVVNSHSRKQYNLLLPKFAVLSDAIFLVSTSKIIISFISTNRAMGGFESALGFESSHTSKSQMGDIQ
jgi:hypothetical protein